MDIVLKSKIEETINKAQKYCSQQYLEIVFVNTIPDTVLEVISNRTQTLPAMYYANADMLKTRVKNGAYIIKENDSIVGHIFAHRHEVHNHSVFERCSLWVHPKHRNNNLGLLLMDLLTEKYQKEFLISIAKEPSVHNNNELLGMKHVSLSELSQTLIATLEEIGKLRDEYDYKYYVNPYFENKIKQFNKVLNGTKQNQ